MRIGIYGGSFDPIHVGHLLIAETAREQLQLDRVVFLPTAQSPLKQETTPADSKARIEMIQLAIGGHPAFVLDDREIQRGGISYTVDTLKELTTSTFAKNHSLNDSVTTPSGDGFTSTVNWFLIIGADSLADFPRWRTPAEILRLASLAVVARGGHSEIDWSVLEPYADAAEIDAIKQNEIHMPQIEISSRDIRHRVATGKSIRYLVSPAVDAFIRSKNIYCNSIRNT